MTKILDLWQLNMIGKAGRMDYLGDLLREKDRIYEIEPLDRTRLSTVIAAQDRVLEFNAMGTEPIWI